MRWIEGGEEWKMPPRFLLETDGVAGLEGRWGAPSGCVKFAMLPDLRVVKEAEDVNLELGHV